MKGLAENLKSVKVRSRETNGDVDQDVGRGNCERCLDSGSTRCGCERQKRAEDGTNGPELVRSWELRGERLWIW